MLLEDAAQAAEMHGVQLGSGQACPGKTRICPVADTLDCGTRIRMWRPYSMSGKQILTARRNPCRAPLPGLRQPGARKRRSVACGKLMAGFGKMDAEGAFHLIN